MLDGFSFPVLSAIIWVPIIAGVVILFMDSKQRDLVLALLLTELGLFFESSLDRRPIAWVLDRLAFWTRPRRQG